MAQRRQPYQPPSLRGALPKSQIRVYALISRSPSRVTLMASDRDTPTASDHVAALYEQLEGQAAQASEHLVGTRGFAGLLGQLAENTAALTKLGNDAMDLVLRNLRLAG